MSTALFNTRGRLIWIEDKQVSNFLREGFVYPPRDHDNRLTYNPVYDKGSNEIKYQSRNRDIIKNTPIPKPTSIGNTLNAEIV